MTGKLVAFSALAAVGAAALYEGFAIRSYTITTPKWEHGNHARFAVVSDLHSVLFGEEQRGILAVLRRLQPDYILLPGDIVDEHRPPIHAHAFLCGAADIAPTWFAPGNHEYRAGCLPSIIRMVERCGVTALLDTAAAVDTLAGPMIIAGCEDPEKTKRCDPRYDWRARIRRNFGGMGQSEAFAVLLAHHPEYSQLYGTLGFDLVVSGHAHGGQARMPFLLNGVIAPDEGLLPHYAGGCYRQGQTAHIVSRGVVVYAYVPRIFNPPEIVCIEVMGTGEFTE